jgi:peptide/nickel transport system substrate-binding protein
LPPYFPQHPALAATDQPQPFAESGIIGNGPYQLDHFWVNREIALTANPAYTLGDVPLTPTIVLRQYARSQDLRDALRSHDVDLAWRALMLDHMRQLEDESGLKIVDTPSTRVFYLYFSQQREPTDDPLVREAITRFLNRQPAIDKILYGSATALTSLVPPLFPAAYADLWPAEPDLALGEDLLSTAGYKDRAGRRVGFNFVFGKLIYGETQDRAMVQLLLDSLGDTHLVDYGYYPELDLNTATGMLEGGDATVAAFGWTPVVPHPYAYLYPLFDSSQPKPKGSRYARPEIDAALNRIALTDDPAEQRTLYEDVQVWALEDYAIAPLWQDHIQVMTWDDIGGILVEANFFLHYDRLVRE